MNNVRFLFVVFSKKKVLGVVKWQGYWLGGIVRNIIVRP